MFENFLCQFENYKNIKWLCNTKKSLLDINVLYLDCVEALLPVVAADSVEAVLHHRNAYSRPEISVISIEVHGVQCTWYRSTGYCGTRITRIPQRVRSKRKFSLPH